MTHYTQYLNYHVALLKEFQDQCQKEYPFNSTDLVDEEATLFLNTLATLCTQTSYNEDSHEKGQWLVSRIVSSYTHLMPLFPRDVMWFFGGDCLHYMPDEEISFYQQLDELRFTAEDSGKSFDFAEAKRTLRTLN